MKGRRLGAASAGLLAATALSNLSMVVYHHVLSQRLGPAYAQLAVLMAVWNVLANVTLGLNTWLVKAFSADAELKGPGAVGERLRGLVKPGLVSLGLVTALLALASPFVASYWRLPNIGPALMVDGLFVGGVLLLTLRSAEQGLHYFFWLSLSVAGEGLARLVVVLPLVGGVFGGLAVFALGQVCGCLCAWGGLSRLGPAPAPVRPSAGGPALGRGLWEGASDTLALTLLALLCYLDVLVLKHHYGDERAALYSRAALVAKSFLYLPVALNMILLSAAAREFAGGRDPRGLLRRFLLWALALDAVGLALVWAWTPLCLGVLVGFDPLYRTAAMVGLTRWFSVAVIPLGLLQMVVAYLLAVRRKGVVPGLGVLVLVYLGLLRFAWDSELAVVAVLGACSLLGLAAALGLALARPPATPARATAAA